MQDLVVLDSGKLNVRIALLIAIVAAIVFGWFAIRWQLGDMFANLTQLNDENAAGIADAAINLAPSDPTAFRLAALSSADPAITIKMFEQAVRTAPNDYRWRIELGRAYEQDGQTGRAESEIKKAVDLAPSYASVHWHLGNFYLRRERNDEAIAELKKATRNSDIYRDQVFSLVWDKFNKDPRQVEDLAGDEPDSVARVTYFFAAHGKAQDSLRNWNKLSDGDKADNFLIAKSIAEGLYIQRHFPQSLEFARQLGIDTDAQPETVTNPSFEKAFSESVDSRFGWQVFRNDPRLDIALDAKVKHEGNGSLRALFRSYVKSDLSNILQTIVVVPNKKYRLSFWVRTENLKSAGPPLIDVVNANDGKLIIKSRPFASGTSDWQEMAVEFTTPENCDGISIRTSRSFCGEDCPVSGTLWYDDFAISREEATNIAYSEP
ncbi:MAG: tetratricopeptide repeat protein [Pyrinomonadaceae bacterium]